MFRPIALEFRNRQVFYGLRSPLEDITGQRELL